MINSMSIVLWFLPLVGVEASPLLVEVDVEVAVAAAAAAAAAAIAAMAGSL